jgi:hypothetical protein
MQDPLHLAADWARAHKAWASAIAVSALLVALLLVVGAIAGAPADKSSLPHGAVGGSMDTHNSIVKADQVWCMWDSSDSHVEMHIRFKNTGVEDASITYTTKYEVKDGGTHGDSAVTNFEVTRVAAGETVIVTDDAGHPDGVIPGSPLSACEPHAS